MILGIVATNCVWWWYEFNNEVKEDIVDLIDYVNEIFDDVANNISTSFANVI